MGSLSGTSVVVVGGGFGGLSTACYLADAGADVVVVEKNEQLGGRAGRLEADGFRFDMGPSWYLMPDVFERFFGHFGTAPGAYYDLEQLDPHYRVFWKDGDSLDVVPDRERMAGAFEAYEPGAGDALAKYLAASERHYEAAMEGFVYEDRARLRDWLDPDVLRAAPVGLRLLGTMDDYVSGYFDHPKLRQLVQYTLVFLGGSPANTPALYSMMSHVDFELGVHYPEGGMGAVVDAVADLAAERGARFVLDAEVVGITPLDGDATADERGNGTTNRGRAGGDEQSGFLVRTADGAEYRPDVVVSDADYAHTEGLLPPEARGYDEGYWESRTLAPSAFLAYLGVEGDVEPLAHHTLVLPTDWDAHFEAIFDDPAWPDDPAYYLCVPSKTDDGVAPAGHSNLFVLVPIAPGLDDGPEARARYRDAILEDVAEHTGVDLRDRIVFEEHFSVSEFADRYNSLEGTALGLAHTLRQTAFMRPDRRSSAVDGLYFTGSYTTPGIGVPMCLISGEHTARAVIEDRGRRVPTAAR